MKALTFTLMLAASSVVSAADLFKCTALDGSVAFQDSPCSTSMIEEINQLPPTAAGINNPYPAPPIESYITEDEEAADNSEGAADKNESQPEIN